MYNSIHFLKNHQFLHGDIAIFVHIWTKSRIRREVRLMWIVAPGPRPRAASRGRGQYQVQGRSGQHKQQLLMLLQYFAKGKSADIGSGEYKSTAKNILKENVIDKMTPCELWEG